MKRTFLLFLMLALICSITHAQVNLTPKQIKALKKEIVFGEKYKYHENAKARWIIKKKKTADSLVVDTVSVFLKMDKKLKLKNEILVTYEGKYSRMYSGDSIFTKTASSHEYISVAGKKV